MHRSLIVGVLFVACWINSIAAAQTAGTSAPGADFAHTVPPPVPDYALATSWARRPVANAAGDVDVFYVYPTTFRGPGWNQDVGDAAANAVTDAGVMETQASAFSRCCRLYAPRYRQASWRAFKEINGQGIKAYDLAYEDVKSAFSYYLQHDNHNRPFILAGHSQGALQVSHLLEDMVDGKPVGDRLVAAYVIGIGVPKGFFGKLYKTTTICAKPDDTGCFVGWNSLVTGSDISEFLKQSAGRYIRLYGDDPGKTPVCINPLTFDLDRPDGDKSLHRGAVTKKGLPISLETGAVSARCAGGALFVDQPSDPNLLHPLPGGSLHLQDVELFYGNLSDNAAIRGRAWLSRYGR